MRIKIKKKETKLDKFDKKINSIVDLLIPVIIIAIPTVFLLYILNLHGYLFPNSYSSPFIGLNYLYKYFMYILVIIYLYKMFFKKVAITKSDIFLFIFMFFTILSTVFAVDKQIALYGYPNRYEGMITILFYCFLYLDCKLLSKDMDIKYLVRIIMAMSIIHLIFVILQQTGLYEKVIYMYTSNDAIGLTENKNFLGSLMCMIGSIGMCGYLLLSKKDSKNYCLFIFIVSYVVLLFANSSGPFLSILLTLIILIIYLIIKKQLVIKKILVVILSIIVIYPICLYKNDTITPEIKSNMDYVFKSVYNIFNNKSTNKFNNESDSINNEVSSDDLNIEYRQLGNGRIRIWSNVIELIEKKPLLGYGPDNLGVVYKKSVDDNKIADKAHNIYLHIFVSSGIFALIGYILWIGYTIYLGIKSNDRIITILCFGIIAYSIQGIFNINVLEVTPYFYMITGLMMLLVNEKRIN